MRAASGSERAGHVEDTHFRAGSELREARERLGWDLGEVAAVLRIKLAYLEAIEDGRVSALPGNAYALGFLRTYATTLGLDADDVARRFRAEAQDVNRKTELAFPAPVPERGIPTGAMVVLGLGIAAVGYFGWYRLSDHEHTATHTVPPVPEQLMAAPKAAPVSPQVASVLPPPGSTPPTPASVPQAVKPAPVEAAAPPPAAGADRVAADQAASAPPPPQPAPAVASAPPVTPAPAPTETGLVLHASAITWVQVRAPGGHVIWDHVMQPGDSWQVPADQPGLTLTTGNAGGLAVFDNGLSMGDFGHNGAVRHNVTLTEAALREALGGPGPNAPGAAAPATPPVPHPVHHSPPSSSPDESADQLNARQLGQH